MAVNSKAIKRRMKSVGNTKKITKAMEMVSAAKMRRAVEATLSTRPYAALAREIMERLTQGQKDATPLLTMKPVEKILIILVTANRGLCGSFNANLYKKMFAVVRDRPVLAQHRDHGSEDLLPAKNDVQIDILGVGKKSAWIAKKLNLNLIAVFDTLNEKPTLEEVLPVCQMALQNFIEDKYQKVAIVYTDYKSSLLQTAKVRQVLPISEADLEKMTEPMALAKKNAGEVEFDLEQDHYLFEPDMISILSTVLPRLAEVQIYQAILESAASEHSARMVAMKSATDAASDMLTELRLNYNKARQAAITQEISEIVGGAAALE